MKRNFPLKKLSEILTICSLGILLCISFRPNYAKLQELQRHHSLLKQKLRLEEKRNYSLKRELNGLSNDPNWIEKIAREKFGWARPKESVYRFPSRKN